MDTAKYKQADTCPTLISLFDAEELPPFISLGYCEMRLQRPFGKL
jgi:hypothetical protein